MYPIPKWRQLRKSALVLLLLLAACSDPFRTSVNSDTAQVLAGSDPFVTRTDPVDIVHAEIQGDDLRLQLRFGGGCAEHDFALVHSGEFRESHPVQTTLTLMHDAHGDMCRALLGREITFDLSPVKQAYRRAYSEHGVIIVHLAAPGPGSIPTPSVRYVF
jgi:hypothetical protein